MVCNTDLFFYSYQILLILSKILNTINVINSIKYTYGVRMKKNTNKIIYFLMLIMLSFSVFGDTFTGDYTNFGTGTFTNTEISGQSLKLVSGQSTGTFESKIVDFSDSLKSNNFKSIFYSLYDINDLYQSSMISYYSFEEIVSTFDDISPNNNILSNSNVNYGQVGKIGNAVSFTGTDTSYSVVSPLTNAPTDAFSVSFWVKTSNTEDRDVFSYASTIEKREIGVTRLNDLRVVIDNTEYDTNINLANNIYRHVVVTWTSATGSTNVYIDGVLTSSFILKQGYTFTSNGALMIGQRQDGVNVVKSGNGFIGTVDEFGLYNRVLTDSEIKQIYGKYLHNVNVEVKTCDDVLCDTETYTTLTSPKNENLELTENRYFRYKVTLTGSTTSTPSFLSLTMNYTTALSLEPIETSPNQEYKIFGYNNMGSFAVDGTGLWNTNTEGEKGISKFIDNEGFFVTSKVSYLDDGKKYIITYSAGEITLYQFDSLTQTLNVVDGYDITLGGFAIAGDIVVQKQNGKNYIVVPLRSTSCTLNRCLPYLAFLTYDGEFTYSRTSLRDPVLGGSATGYLGYGDGTTNHAMTVNCNANYCIAVYQTSATGVLTNGGGSIAVYVKNQVRTDYQVFSLGFRLLDNENACMYTPIGRNVVLGNVDNDLIEGSPYDYDDVLFNAIGYKTGDNKFHNVIVSFNVNSTEIVGTDWINSYPMFSDVGDFNCDQYEEDNPLATPSRFATGLTVFDFDGKSSNGLEIFVGQLEPDNQDNYKLYEYSSDGSDITVHPTTRNLEGIIISNPFVLNCYGDTGKEDIGVITYDDVRKEATLMCSCSDCIGFDNCEYKSFEEVDFNITSITNNGKSVHSFQAIDGLTSTSEIITPFGVFSIEEPTSASCFVQSSETTKIYNIAERDSFVYPVDYENNGRMDLLFTSETNLKYLDDGFANQIPYINFASFDPCAGIKTIKRGSDLLIKLKSFDDESDLVSYKVIIYAGHPTYEEESEWSDYQNSNLEFRYNTKLNYDIGIGYIEIYVKDSKHTQTNMIEQIFSVNNDTNSVSFGEGCINTLDSDTLLLQQETGDTLPTTDPDYVDKYGNSLNNNAVSNGLNSLGSLFGFGSLLTYLILMLVIAIGMFFYVDMGTGHGNSKIGAIILVEGLLFIIGLILGIIPIAIVIMLIILVLLILSIWAGSYVLMSRGNN